MSADQLRTPNDLRRALDIPFSDEQLSAIAAPLEPGVIIAGAGSGKTTVMAARVVWLVGSGAVRADQVLGLTFTRKAAGELSHRVSKALSATGLASQTELDETMAQTVMTYDAFAGNLVAEHAPRIGIDPAQNLLSDASRYRLASEVVENSAAPLTTLTSWSQRTLVTQTLALDSAMTQHLVPAEQIERFTIGYRAQLDQAPGGRSGAYRAILNAELVADQRLELLHLVQAYRAAKEHFGWVEFGDRMAQAAQIAEQAPQVSAELRERYGVVLLDEYQDTSSAQARFLRALFSGQTAGEGRGHPVTAVGDPYQSIYGWRGAAASNIAQFPAAFPQADGSPAGVLTLRTNRRSGPEILAGANRIVERLHDDPAMPRLRGVDTSLRAADDAEHACVNTRHFTSIDDEFEWIADSIAQDLPPSGDISTAVLVRRNSHIEPLFRRLAARDVPVDIPGLSGLLELAPISELICTLRLLDDDGDNAALVQLLTSRRWRLGTGDLAALGRAAKQLSTDNETQHHEPTVLVDAMLQPHMDLSAEGERRVRALAGELKELRRHVHEPLVSLVRRIASMMFLGVELTADPGFAGQQMSTQLARFFQVVGEFTDLDGSARLSGFLAYVQSVLDEESGLEQVLPPVGRGVTLMTIHRAKGLEWDTVYLPALVKDTFPSKGRGVNWITGAGLLPARLRGDADSIPQLEEVTKQGLDAYKLSLREAGLFAEDRLAYVAVTRARRRLVATTHLWEPQAKAARSTSPYYMDLLPISGGEVPPAAERGDTNPVAAVPRVRPWPVADDPEQSALLASAADIARHAMGKPSTTASGPGDAETLSPDEEEHVAGWRHRMEKLVTAARQQAEDADALVAPTSLSASAFMGAQRNPEEFLASLRRPMPRRPSGGATVGTMFHDWVEARFRATSGQLIDDSELITDALPAAETQDLRRFEELCRCFVAGAYADRIPHRVEVPFVLVLGEQQIRGRIDAVYRLDGDGQYLYQVVDWKTSNKPANVLQLALYRLAWAQVCGIDPDRVQAVFHYVASGRTDAPGDLPGREELERMAKNLPGARDGG